MRTHREGFFVIEAVVYCALVACIAVILFQSVVTIGDKLRQRTLMMHKLGAVHAAYALFARDMHSASSHEGWHMEPEEVGWRVKNNAFFWRFKEGVVYRITGAYDTRTGTVKDARKSIVMQGLTTCTFTYPQATDTAPQVVTLTVNFPCGNRSLTIAQTNAVCRSSL